MARSMPGAPFKRNLSGVSDCDSIYSPAVRTKIPTQGQKRVLNGVPGRPHLITLEWGASDRFPSKVAKSDIMTDERKKWFGRKQRPQIFLSFNHRDRGWSDWVAERLENSGYVVWRDVVSISASASFQAEIANAIENSSLMVVLMSPSYFTSSWAQMETALAVDKKLPIVPAMIEPCEVTGILTYLHYADLTSNREEGIQRVIDAVHQILAGRAE